MIYFFLDSVEYEISPVLGYGVALPNFQLKIIIFIVQIVIVKKKTTSFKRIKVLYIVNCMNWNCDLLGYVGICHYRKVRSTGICIYHIK